MRWKWNRWGVWVWAVLCPLGAYAQPDSTLSAAPERVHLVRDISAVLEGAFPTGQDLRKAFGFGLGFRVGPTLNVLRNQLLLEPSFGAAFYSNRPEGDITDRVQTYQFLLSARYCLELPSRPGTEYYPIVSLGGFWGNNTWSFTQTNGEAYSFKVLGLSGLMARLGVGTQWKGIRIEGIYEYATASFTATEDFTALLQQSNPGYVIAKRGTRLDLSRFIISIGYAFSL